LDALLLGGIGILSWLSLLFFYRSGFFSPSLQGSFLQILSVIFGFGGIVVNAPHFYWSYKLAYSQGPSYVWRNRLQLVCVPLLLISVFWAAALSFVSPPFSSGLRSLFEPLAEAIGLEDYLRSYANMGTFLLGSLFVAQYTAVGWHYVKQAYGTGMLSARFANYELDPSEARLCRWALFGVWFCYLFEVNAGHKTYSFAGLHYSNLNWPKALVIMPQVYAALMLGFVLYRVVWRRWKDREILPPVAAVAPFLSVYCWFIPAIYLKTPGFFENFVPFFHGLQYLTFVTRVEVDPKGSRERTWGRYFFYWSMIAGVGYFFSAFLPTRLDARSGDFAGSISFFAVLAYLFLNLHHYFIDNVIWRSTNPEIRRRLQAHLL
jgi:hypothetical protein